MSTILEQYIKTFLVLETPRWKKEGTSIEHELQKIKKFVDLPYHYINLSLINKLGVYPNSSESTGPWGIYCYPLVSNIYDQMIENRLPIAGDRPFIHLFTVTDPKNVLIIGSENGLSYDKNRIEQDINNALSLDIVKEQYKGGNLAESIRETVSNIRNNYRYPGGGIYSWASEMAGQNARRWTKILSAMGYIGVHDGGTGTIYGSEPIQAVFFSTEKIKFIETFYNVYHSNTNSPIINAHDKTLSSDEKDKRTLGNILRPTKEIVDRTLANLVKENPAYEGFEDKFFTTVQGLNLILNKVKSIRTEKSDNIYVAILSKTPYDLLLRLINTRDYKVREAVANLIKPQDVFLFENTLFDNDILEILKKKIQILIKTKEPGWALEQCRHYKTSIFALVFLPFIPKNSLSEFVNSDLNKIKIYAIQNIDSSIIPSVFNQQLSKLLDGTDRTSNFALEAFRRLASKKKFDICKRLINTKNEWTRNFLNVLHREEIKQLFNNLSVEETILASIDINIPTESLKTMPYDKRSKIYSSLVTKYQNPDIMKFFTPEEFTKYLDSGLPLENVRFLEYNDYLQAALKSTNGINFIKTHAKRLQQRSIFAIVHGPDEELSDFLLPYLYISKLKILIIGDNVELGKKALRLLYKDEDVDTINDTIPNIKNEEVLAFAKQLKKMYQDGQKINNSKESNNDKQEFNYEHNPYDDDY